MRSLSKFFLVAGIIALITGCEVSTDANGGNSGKGNQSQKKVDWSVIPAEFNPSIDDIAFETDGFNMIDVNAFGFKDDFEVIYSPEVAPGYGYLRAFKVWKKQASWGDLRPRSKGTSIELKSYGSYRCAIEIKNGRITKLEGGCYIKLQVILPVGSQMEVYNVGNLITKRFIFIRN